MSEPAPQPAQPAPTTDADRQREDRATRWAALAFGIAMVAALGLLVVYAVGGNTQLEGVLLFVTFGAVGTGFGIWIRLIVGSDEIVEDRYPMPSPPADRKAFGDEFEASLGEVAVGGRRRFLLRLLAGVGASLGLALTAPLLSLGPIFSRDARNELFVTDWRQGIRLVTPTGEPLRLEDLVEDQIVTVFPEDADTPPDSQAVLIRSRSERLDAAALPLPDGIVDSVVCYSKICTHAGCPVGLYRAAAGELLCPCHQSTFDVNRGAAVRSGPAGRPLPQLPIGVDDEGFLVALGDFSSPVGPSFWNLTQGGPEVGTGGDG